MGKKKRESYPTTKIYLDDTAYDIPVSVHEFIDRHMKMFNAMDKQMTVISETVSMLADEMKLDDKKKKDLAPHHFVAIDISKSFKAYVEKMEKEAATKQVDLEDSIKEIEEETTAKKDKEPSLQSDEES
jgi:hypothetical protein